MATTPRSPQIYYSNSVEALEQALRAELFSSNTGPFTRRIVVVSSQAMEQWLRFRFAGPSGLGICMGPEFLFAPKVVQELCGLLGVQAPQTLDPLSLGIRIEAELKQCFDFWPELQRALPEGRGDRRLPLLAKRLASLFDRYQQYGQRVLPHWYHDADAWQKQLWCRLFPDPQAMPALDSIPQELDGSTEVHLFGLAFMPRPMIRFFGAVGRYMPVSQYVLSPCQAFWTDIVSDRSTRRLRLYWKDRGASQAQLDDLDLYLRDRNPLLANFGRLGREFHRSLEDLAGDPIEHYVINQLLDEDDYYAAYRGGEIEPQNDRGQKTLLQWIQADMLFLHKPARGEHRQLSAEDCSLEVHKAPTRQREVEILYDNILRLIHQHSETDSPLLAHEILVMAPDIREYAPFLRAQFGTGDCPLQCQVMDVPLAEQSPYLQAFFSVLDLVDSRWELPRVSELLEHPVVLGHLGWSLDQRLTVRRWLRSLGLSWGMQAQNREDALIRDYCEKGIEGAPQAGTWEFAFRRLLRGLVQQQDAAQRSAGVLAFEGVDASDCELLETLIAYLRGLFSHLDPCGSGEERSLSAWCDHLLCLCDAFLSIPSDEIGWKRDQETLFQAILQLQRLGRELPQAMLSFASVRTRIEDMCAEQARIMNERLFHAVRCCSLVPMRSIPARAIFLLGMSKDDFPRQDETQSLNLLRNESEADYCPSRVDFDRYLFLESLISARDHLIISYPSYSFREKAEVFPSTVLSELIHYVDGAFQFGPRSFQDARIYAHPFHPHASGYFHGDPHPIQGFNRRHFERAQALARPSAAARRFVAGVSVDGTAADPTMDVRRLERALRNPARSYLQERMGIYIHEAELLSPDEAAGLSPLLLYRWRDQVLEGKEDTERHVLEQSSNLPLGPLRRAAFQVLEEEQESCLEKAKGFGISPQDIWTVSLSAHCEAPIQQDARHWVFPAIELPSNEKVVGDILDVSSRGILSLGSDSLEALVKDWHRIVLVAELNQRYDLGWKTDFLSLKDGKARAICLEDPASDLSRLVQHVHDVTTHCTLLYPNWIETFLKMNIEEGLSRIQCTLEETRYGAGPARELLWLLAEGGEGMLQEKYTEWAKRARQIWRLPLASAFARVSKGWLE